MANIHYIRQKETLGLGHAILCAQKFIGNETFAILLGDDIVVSPKPCLLQMIDIYNTLNRSIIGLQEIPCCDVNKYGIVKTNNPQDKIIKIDDLVEKPNIENAPSRLAVMERYIIEPEIFNILASSNLV